MQEDSVVQLGTTIWIDFWFRCMFLKKKETCRKSACQISYRRVLMSTKSACGFLKSGFF